jgi:hypothetical protein
MDDRSLHIGRVRVQKLSRDIPACVRTVLSVEDLMTEGSEA